MEIVSLNSLTRLDSSIEAFVLGFNRVERLADIFSIGICRYSVLAFYVPGQDTSQGISAPDRRQHILAVLQLGSKDVLPLSPF